MIGQHLQVLPVEDCALASARGRMLRQVVMAERDNPPFDRVCMDGVAVDSRAVAAGLNRLHVQATQAAGAAPLALTAPDHCIEAMTGAVLPLGTDCVIPLEDYDLDGAALTLKPGTRAEPWLNIQRRGSDSQRDQPMLRPGCRLGAAEVAVLASAGLATVQVSRLPRIRVVSTGDELVEAGLPIADHQVRRSNAHAVLAALQSHGYSESADDHLPDDEMLMRSRLAAHLAEHDVLVLSGGVSKGKFDYVPRVLQSLGVREIFQQVAQRPGRPLWFGVGPQGQVVFGLPGNPVSTLVCLRRYVLPSLAHMSAAAPAAIDQVQLAQASAGRRMTYFMPVRLRLAGGAALATPCPPSGSGDFLALADTQGFIELPPRPEGYPAGFVADYYGW